MTDPTTRELLARVASLEAEMAAMRRRRRLGRRILPLASVALLVALLPLTVLATAPFTDLTGGVHDANIDAIYQAGVTKGCVPDQEYCPTANVTREEMASFLARLGGLGDNPPVAHAKTALTAGDAATLGGLAPSGLVRVGRHSGSASSIVGSASNPVVVATLTLTAPADGFVLVQADMQALNTDATGCLCELWAELRDTTNNATTPYWVDSHVTNTATLDSISIHWVFPVAAGARSFVLETFRFSGTATHLQAFAEITALYVPFGSTGGSTLDQP